MAGFVIECELSGGYGPTAPLAHVDTRDRVKIYQHTVGGCFESLENASGRYTALCNDESLLRSMPTNLLASAVLEFLGFEMISMHRCAVHGTVVILGYENEPLARPQIEALGELCAYLVLHLGDVGATPPPTLRSRLFRKRQLCDVYDDDAAQTHPSQCYVIPQT
jgi:hypothetical protein